MTTIPAQVLSSFNDSISQGYINLFASSSRLSINEGSPSTSISHLVHVCPDLASKPAVPPLTPDLSKVGRRDPFQGPEFGKGEKVLELEGGYSVVHNLHALMPEHAMIVPRFPTGEFRAQTTDLLQSDLGAAWEVVDAYEKEGREVVMFFNGGPLAGASQPHLHMQFCPFQDGPPAPEALARSLPFPSSDSPPSLLPLPYLHFYAPLPAHRTPSTLHTLYTTLLQTSSTHLSTLPSSLLPPSGPKRSSYNLFLTTQFMHLIPRTSRLVQLPRVKSVGQGFGDGVETLRLSVNGLVMLGYWYVGSEEEKEDLIEGAKERGGLGGLLRECGYGRE